ncbi:MAG: hypothetical protein KA201_26165 [Kofleriaceae bacterium]|nr:hypothetical protein [Kofleriaceae bacterium]
MSWSRDRQVRYAHHVLLPDIGGRSQDRLGAATAVVDVDGRAGQLAALYLAAAGVGTLALRGGAAAAPPGFPFDAAAPGVVAVGLAAAVAARNPEVAVRAAAPTEAALAIADDRPDLPLADALARGGEAAARWLHACATAEAP